MTHLSIEQNRGTRETVASNVVKKLYDLAKEIELDPNGTITLKGWIYTNATYKDYITYLLNISKVNGEPLLTIEVGREYIRFEDPEVLRITLAHNVGDGTGVTLVDLTSVTNINDWFKNNNTITSLNDLLKFTNVTSITNIATNDTNLISVTLGEGILEIANNCFYNCSSLLTINFPTTLTKINDNRQTNDWGAFQNCTALTTITGGENITVLGPAFTNCSNLLNLGDIDLSNLIHLGGACFANCENLELGSVTLSNSITTIADTVFKACRKLTSISIPGVTTITPSNGFAQGSFYECNHLTTVTGSNIAYVGQMSFRYCSALSSIDLSNCTYIGICAFQDCTSLTSIDLSSCITVETSAFQGCTSLTNVVDLSNVTSIGGSAFQDCTSLGLGQTLDLNLTNLTTYPGMILSGTKYTRLILHSPQLLNTYDSRYPAYANMNLLLYLDLSDWRPAKDASNNNNYGDSSFYNNNSLVTYIAPITTNYIGTIIVQLGNYSNFRYLILLPTTPPRIQTMDSNLPPSVWFYNRSGNVHIYVPDSAKASYLANPDWASIGGYNGSDTITDRLHGLSELPNGVWTTGLASQYLTPALLATS